MINKVILVGNVGADPEVRSAGDAKVANFNLATSESYKDKNTGEKKTNTEWHRITVWRGLAEVVEKYVKKGTQLYIEGKLHTRSYEDENGVKKYSTEVIADTLKMLGGGQKQENNNHVPVDSPLESQEEDLPF